MSNADDNVKTANDRLGAAYRNMQWVVDNAVTNREQIEAIKKWRWACREYDRARQIAVIARAHTQAGREGRWI